MTASEQFYPGNSSDAYKVMLAAERAMNDYVNNIVKREAHSLRSPLEEFRLTASEIQVFNYLKENFREAEAAWLKHECETREAEERTRAEHERRTAPCLFVGGTNDGRRIHVLPPESFRVWLFAVPDPAPTFSLCDMSGPAERKKEVYYRMTVSGIYFYAHSSLTFNEAIALLFKHYKP